MWGVHNVQDGDGYPPWMAEYEGNSPSMGSSFPTSPITPSVPFAVAEAQQAIMQAQHTKTILKALSQRVQKLERSRGQMSKDISDMLAESREMMKLVGTEPPAIKKGSAVAFAEASAAGDGQTLGVSRRGTRTKTAPASAMPRIVEAAEPAPTINIKKAQSEKLAAPPGLAMPLPDSLTVTTKAQPGGDKQVLRVEWRIDNVKAKFKDCVGRPLVSPPFEVGGLPDCRLMVSPNLGVDISGLSMREQKNKYEAKISEGPLSGALKFKVVSSVGDRLVIQFSLFVGTIEKGPIQHDFAEHIIHGVDFATNWLDELQGTSLVVGVEVLDVEKLQQ